MILRESLRVNKNIRIIPKWWHAFRGFERGIVLSVREFIAVEGIKYNEIFNGFTAGISIWLEEPIF